jgi:hypothetical protein
VVEGQVNHGIRPGSAAFQALQVVERAAMRLGAGTTWHTWLEQGRGDAPSSAVLDRIHAL